MKKIAILLIALMVVSVGFLSGCNEKTSEGGTAPIINSFTATPAVIILGKASVLNWSVEGATSVSIDNGVGNVALNGPYTVFPIETQKYTITVSNAHGTINASITVYVYEDYTTMPQNETIFNPTDDTTIEMRIPDYNFGSSTSIDTKNRYGAGASYDQDWERDLLIRFDISDIPTGTSIASAKLYLFYYNWYDNSPAGRNLTIYRITSDWNEETVTWNTKPSYDPTLSASATVPSAPGKWMSWNVTSDVQKFVNGEKTNFGWQMIDEVPWGKFDIPYTKFYSKENGDNIPYLEIIT